jgi:pyrroline-5-carboxylate reductase
MNHHTIAFIGGGNMAASLIGGLLADGWPAQRVRVADPDPAQLERLGRQYAQVVLTQDNSQAAQGADIVLFAVKPQMSRSAIQGLAEDLEAASPLIISIAAGVRCDDVTRWLGGGLAVVRCMPNTPALVRSGATGLYAGAGVTEAQREQAESILRAVGLTLWFEDEAQLDAVTAVSGSGPAYFLLVMEAIEAAGVRLGLPREAARLLTLQTAFGTAKLALESPEDTATLRRRVTSKGGTTERALEQLEAGHIMALFDQALRAAAARSRELEDELGSR